MNSEQFAGRHGLPPGKATALALEHGFMRHEYPVKMAARFVVEDGRLTFNLLPNSKDDWALFGLGALINSTNAQRLRICPRCQKFWYCAGRIDQRACSKACKTALWQKTPSGRQHKRDYMRRYRTTLRRLSKINPLKHGRKLHASLRKGE